MTRTTHPVTDPHPAQADRALWVGRAVLFVITLSLLALLGRVYQLQHRPGERLADEAGHRYSTQTLPARRGSLLDRTGRVLAVSRMGYRLFVDPTLITDFAHFAGDLAHAIGDDPARIDRLIGHNADRRYVVVTPLLDDWQVEAIRRLERRAIGLESVAVREYPHGRLAGQVVGFVGAEDTGLEGAEFAFDATLAGVDGRFVCARDARRRPTWSDPGDYRPPRHGDDVRLSLDLVVQGIAERRLADACTHFRADAGQAVVMDAQTGQLLAIANWPAFDPDEGGNARPDARRNRAITDPYEPGSIFKPFVFSAATAQRVANPAEKIDTTDSGFYVSPAGRRLRDAHAHGTITWDQVLVQSSNIGMAIVGQRLGAEKMHAAVTGFGFGQLSGSGIPGETTGIVNPLGRWNHYSVTSVPMGQEIAVTPVQMVRGLSAFANGGVMPTPSINADHADRPLYRRAIDRDAADHTRSVLRRVITEGTGRKANSKRYRLWGKTGTAQVPDRVNGGYLDRTYTASFVCGAPLHEPRIIVTVVVHRPDPAIGHYGGTVAAPPAMHIVEQTLDYLGVPPDNHDGGGRNSPLALR